MSSTPLFINGQQSSASKFVSALEQIRSMGTGVLENLTAAQVNTLVEFNRRLQAINSRRTRANRITAPEQAAKFIVSDFIDIDQADTVATVRANNASVTLKERAIPAEAVVQSTIFTANEGSIEALNPAQTIMTVSTFDGTIPTGTFNITLITALTLNQLIINSVASPSSPTVSVSVSSDGVVYTPATRVIVNGYVITAWVPSMLVKHIQIQITPAMPDDLNGDAYTFGITSLVAQATEYYLRSDFLSKPIKFFASSENVVFNANSDPDILYYLSIWPDGFQQAPFIEIASGDTVQLGSPVSITVTTTSGAPSYLGLLPSNLYPNTLQVTENGIPSKIAFQLSPQDSHLSNMQDEYVIVTQSFTGYTLELLNASSVYNTPRTFTISYVSEQPFGWTLVATT